MSDTLSPVARQPRLPRHARHRLIRVAGHAVGLLPLAWLIFDFWLGLLGPDPIRAMILRTGKAAIIMLTLTLACTPARFILGWNQANTVRRPLGLYTFLYVCLHLLIFIWLDYGFRIRLIVEEIILRRYAVVGFIAFLLLVPLAITSTRSAQQRLGKRWKTLHSLIYLTGVLAAVHYIWLVKNAYTQPLIFVAAIGFLLCVRIPPVKRFILVLRYRTAKRNAIDRSPGTDREPS